MALKVPLTLCLFLVAAVSSIPGDKSIFPGDCTKFNVESIGGTNHVPETCPSGFDCFDGTNCIVDAAAGTCKSPFCSPNAVTQQCHRLSECTGMATENFYIFNEHDCGKHQLCLSGVLIHTPYDCKEIDEDKPYFNGLDCVANQAECCNCQAPVCDPAGGYQTFPAPQNCRQKYSCLDIATTDTYVLVGPTNCPDGESFNTDPAVMDCAPSEEACTSVCDIGDGGVTSPTSISTTTASISSASTSTSSTTTSNPTTSASTSTSNPTTPASTSTKPTTVRTSTTYDGCFDLADFHCLAHGDYAHCTFCDPSYIHCYNTASTPILEDCPKGKLFNTNPAYPGCILPENCPFP